MSKLIILYSEGALLDNDGQLTAGVIPALAEMQQSGYKLVLLASPGGATAVDNKQATNQATNGIMPLTHSQLNSILVSQGISVSHHCDIESHDITAIAGQLAPWLLKQELSLDDSYVAGPIGMASELATHLGISSFSPQSFSPAMDESGQAHGNDTIATWSDFASTVCTKPRTATVVRNSNETAIQVAVDLDSANREIAIDTGIGFFDHMVEQVAKHGGFSLQLQCKGDLHIDEHHTVEDCALALGQALREALGDKHGIGRYGFVLPMDEAEVQVSMDLSARPYFVFNGSFTREHVGELTTEMVPHFFKSLSDTLGASLHITMQGDNAHHQVEVIFKGVGRTLRQALRREGNELPSTKGML